MEKEMLENIKKEAERIKEDSIYSAKGHFESAKCWRYWNYVLMTVSITSLCMSLLLTFIDNCKVMVMAIGFISGLSTIILIFLNPQEKYISHYNSGNRFLALRNKAGIFLEIELNSMDIKRQKKRIKRLNFKRDLLNESSLPIMEIAYRNAKKQIEIDKNTEYRINKEQK